MVISIKENVVEILDIPNLASSSIHLLNIITVELREIQELGSKNQLFVRRGRRSD